VCACGEGGGEGGGRDSAPIQDLSTGNQHPGLCKNTGHNTVYNYVLGGVCVRVSNAGVFVYWVACVRVSGWGGVLLTINT
jgi:hypothetical protein